MRGYDLSSARWRKSSYSDDNGGDCVEVAHAFPGAANWRKSSHSDDNGGSCVEVATGAAGIVPVRDSKVPGGAVLLIGPAAWTEFIRTVRTARF